jgi:hypothetical protein
MDSLSVKNKENAEKADVRHRVVPAPDPGYAVHPENQRKPSAVPPKATRRSPYVNKEQFLA